MAILESHPGIEITVEVEKEKLSEYDDRESKVEGNLVGKVVQKYIESVTGACFQIRYVVKQAYKFDCNHIAIQFYVDGNFITGHVIKPRKKDNHADSAVLGLESYIGPNEATLSKFKFAAVNTGNSLLTMSP
jgi:hypothetical protein